MGDAFEPFRAAAAGLPNSMSDAMPVARICADARRPGTVTTITAGDLRALAAAARPGESRETSWPFAVPGAEQAGATPAEGGDLAALSKKATQGKWLPDVQVYYDEDGGPAEDHTEGVMVLGHDDQPDSIIQCSKEDAEFIVALANAYRSGRLIGYREREVDMTPSANLVELGLQG